MMPLLIFILVIDGPNSQQDLSGASGTPWDV